MSTNDFNVSWGQMNFSSGATEGIPFMKLQQGMNRIRIVANPARISIHWADDIEGKKHKILCPGKEHGGCPICQEIGEKPRTRYMLLVLDRADGVIKQLEVGQMIMKDIQTLAMDADFGDPTKYDIKIQKDGQMRDTRYHVMPAPSKTPLTAAEQELVNKTPSLESMNKIHTADEIRAMNLVGLNGNVAKSPIDDVQPFTSGVTSSASVSNTDDDWGDI